MSCSQNALVATTRGKLSCGSSGCPCQKRGSFYYEKRCCATSTKTPEHGELEGLDDDDHMQYALLSGREGGQMLCGGTDSGTNLTFKSTSDPTRGSIVMDGVVDFVGQDVPSIPDPEHNLVYAKTGVTGLYYQASTGP